MLAMKHAWILGLCLACGGRTGLGVVEAAQSSDSGAPACADVTDSWLLFDVSSSTGGVIYAARQDGTEMHALSLSPGRLQYPAMSPDGKTIAYEAIDANGASLMLRDVASGTSRLLVKRGGRPAWSPDGKTIAYGTGMDLRLIASDGSGDRALLQGPSPQLTGYGNPSFLAGGAALVFDRGGGVETVALDGSGRKVLFEETINTIEFPNPSLSWDRQSMAAVVDCGGVALRRYSLAALPGACESGTVVTKVDAGGVDYSASAWSPAGLIAYMGRQDILVVPASGGSPTNVTAALDLVAKNSSANHPAWTPPCAKVP